MLKYLLVPRLGLAGGAIATALAETGMMCGLMFAVKLSLDIWPDDRRWLKGIAATVCAAAALGLLRIWMGASAQLAIIPNLIVASVVFGGVLLLLGLDPEEKNFLRKKRVLMIAARPVRRPVIVGARVVKNWVKISVCNKTEGRVRPATCRPIERVVAGIVRYRRVYLPSEAQLTELVNDLAPFDLVRAFWPAAIVSHHVRPVAQGETKTTVIDLSKGLETVWARIHSSCR